MRKNTLICENISISKGGNIILQNISFSLMPGACVSLVGAIGSGKTSLLRFIARLDNVNSGTITYNSCVVDEFLNEYKQIILYISDKEQLTDQMTVYETICFWTELYNAEIVSQAAVHTFELEQYLDLQIRHLSKGLKKRVILLRLLLQRARIWLLDEPFVNLDMDSINIVYNIINSHLSNGGILILSDHMRDNSNYTAKDVAELENIGYKVDHGSQINARKVMLVIKDFKCFAS